MTQLTKLHNSVKNLEIQAFEKAKELTPEFMKNHSEMIVDQYGFDRYSEMLEMVKTANELK